MGTLAVALVGVAAALWVALAGAQPPTAPIRPPTRAVGEQGPRWSDLKPAQRAALKPLEQQWPGIDSTAKQKWITMAGDFHRLGPQQQARVQERMAQWATLTPRERGEARLRYQEAREFPLEDREARWKAYQALTPEEREQLAARAAAARKAGAPHGNLVPARPGADYSMSPRPIGPIVVQAGPGATTTLLTRPPSPPRHQQSGMPRIAATPGFVNRATLLPQRGPQGAATRQAVPSAADSAARK